MDKCIAILTVSIGAGHQQVSQALKEELEERGYKAEIYDVFSIMNKQRADRMKAVYFHCIRSFPLLWNWIYRLTDKQVNAVLLRPFLAVCWKELLTFFDDATVEAVIATHPLAAQLGILIKQQLGGNVKLFSVLTDFTAHKMSLAKQADAVFVAEKNEAEQLSKKYGHITIYGLGIPLKKTWDQWEREAVREQLQLSPDQKVIVVSGGGEGLAGEEVIMSLLKNDPLSYSVYWFNGQGREVSEEPVHLKNGSIVYYMPFSPRYSEYVKVADLLISKPGGVSMAEALYWNVPTGMVSPLPGQERMNQSILDQYDNMIILDEHSVLSEIIEKKQQERPAARRPQRLARRLVVDRMISHLEKNQSTLEAGEKKQKRSWRDIVL
ncbi:processive 1,2-diacylglycerol beta-glucosyltransferase [Evansella caseinilytica]|uniref:Processive 1,2-diacylglycerol beta-glucosyltransferase n=1 Tax=Evansella caseinilytica TaxID=1503961 RepID=A0A1H3MST7_9BACI|nr:glycosyltransferase [Evansella caseinilytica]SDY79544.1 processive 1,2-diacylglycerol beta-glucosyltransferase [Evansella caseinilytica]